MQADDPGTCLHCYIFLLFCCGQHVPGLQPLGSGCVASSQGYQITPHSGAVRTHTEWIYAITIFFLIFLFFLMITVILNYTKKNT